MIDRIFEEQCTFEDIEVDEIRKVQLALNVLPQGSNLLKLIAQKAKKEDQSFPIKILTSLFDSANALDLPD